ncbi:lysophospholipid acyltransferase family protein [Lentisphaerota bacterium WC36G]|nr:lysophospholipid acyltransferase family protein [Lentisphaerae bacterium WC36]
MKKKLKHNFRQVKKIPTWLYFFPAMFLRFYKWSTFISIEDRGNAMDVGKTFVTVTWHNRLLFFPMMFPKWIRKQTVAVISASRDGQYIADLISQFNLRATRGSSSRKGARALAGAFKAIKNENNVSFTPDGPRGPKYKMSKGPIYLASQTGTKILPISINYSKYWELKSWDKFQIPKPFCRVKMVLGKPIEIPKNLSDEQLDKYQEIVRQALLDITVDSCSKED